MATKFYVLFFIFLNLPSQYSYSGGNQMGGNQMYQGPPGKHVQGLTPVAPAGQRGQHPIPRYGPGGMMDPEMMEEQEERAKKNRKKGGNMGQYGGFNGGGPHAQGGYVDCEMYDQNTCGMHFESCYWDTMEIECERIKPGQGPPHGGMQNNPHGAYPQGGRGGNSYGAGNQRTPPRGGAAPYGNGQAQGQGQYGMSGGAQGYRGAGAQQSYGGQGGGAYNQGYPPSTNSYGGNQGMQGQGNYGGRPYILSQSKLQTFNPKKTKTYIEEHIMYNPWFWAFTFNCVVITVGITLYGLRTQNKFQIDQLLRYQEA